MDWDIILKQKYVVIVFLAIAIQTINVQFAMPMYPQPQMFAMGPAPIQIAVMPFAMPKNKQSTKKPTTTTTEKPDDNGGGIAVAIPVQMPMPLQMAFPAQAPPSFCASRPKPPGCPPCPPCVCEPSCTPAFFSYCSPCHQKCRCRDSNSAPVPMPPIPPIPVPGPAFPIPMPVGPSAVIVPVPPYPNMPTDRDSCSREEKSRECKDNRSTGSGTDSETSSSGSSDDSTDTSDSSDTDDYYRRSRKKHNNHHKKLKKLSRKKIKMSRRSMNGNMDVLKPVLSFINNRGNVKLNKKLSEADVEHLLNTEFEPVREDEDGNGGTTTKKVQKVKILTIRDDNKPQITVLSDVSDKEESEDFRRSNRKVVLRDDNKQILKHGRKELIFRPPKDKTISNLSLSFAVS